MQTNNLQISFENCVFIKKYTYLNLCRVSLDCNIYFLFDKQAFNGLLKVTGIQIALLDYLMVNNDWMELGKCRETKKCVDNVGCQI